MANEGGFMRRTIFLIASVVVSAFFLWVALRGVDFQQVLISIQQAEMGWIIVSFLGITAGLWTRGIRWQGLLDFKPARLKTCHILNLGFMLNLLPLRVGEVARSILIMREGVPVVTAATSVVLERLIDTLLVVILLVFSITQIPNTPSEIIRWTTVFGAAVVVAFSIMVFFVRFPGIGQVIRSTTHRAKTADSFEKRYLRHRLDIDFVGLFFHHPVRINIGAEYPQWRWLGTERKQPYIINLTWVDTGFFGQCSAA
jgi:uncharacterized membrane protein YbhN (UPF0104 family)